MIKHLVIGGAFGKRMEALGKHSLYTQNDKTVFVKLLKGGHGAWSLFFVYDSNLSAKNMYRIYCYRLLRSQGVSVIALQFAYMDGFENEIDSNIINKDSKKVQEMLEETQTMKGWRQSKFQGKDKTADDRGVQVKLSVKIEDDKDSKKLVYVVSPYMTESAHQQSANVVKFKTHPRGYGKILKVFMNRYFIPALLTP